MTVTRVGWSLVDMASRLLDEPERGVVRGDLAECGSRPGRALREVLGLVVRRQVAPWPANRNNAWVAERLWETRDVSMYLSNPAVIGETLFGFSKRNGGQFFAIDARDGTVLWLGPAREATNSAVVKANTVVFFLNDDGELIVAKASRERFQAVARHVVSETATWAQPAISGNRIFVKDTNSLTLWSLD